MSLTKVATAALSVAFAATLAAAPQATKPAAPAKASDQKPAAAKPAAPKAEMVAKADLPKAVTDAVMKAHPKADISGATKSMKDGKTWFKVMYKDGGKSGSMTVDDMGMAKPAAKKGK
jgi:hypothetical protein